MGKITRDQFIKSFTVVTAADKTKARKGAFYFTLNNTLNPEDNYTFYTSDSIYSSHAQAQEAGHAVLKVFLGI